MGFQKKEITKYFHTKKKKKKKIKVKKIKNHNLKMQQK